MWGFAPSSQKTNFTLHTKLSPPVSRQPQRSPLLPPGGWSGSFPERQRGCAELRAPEDGTAAVQRPSGGGPRARRGRAKPRPAAFSARQEAHRGSATQRAGAAAPLGGAGGGRRPGPELRRMNEAEGLRQRRPLRPQVITEDGPAQEAKEGRWGARPARGCGPRTDKAPLSARGIAGCSVLLGQPRVCPWWGLFVCLTIHLFTYWGCLNAVRVQLVEQCRLSRCGFRGPAVGVTGCCVMLLVCLELAVVQRGDCTPLCAL